MTLNNQQEFSDRIIRILNDDASIPMVLIEGKWGSGKTFFTKNKLIPDIEDSGAIVKYFSVYGVDCLSDFRDKLLSLFYTNHKDTEAFTSPIMNAASEISNNMENSGGVISSVINGLGKVVKKVAISKIKNITLILDDLERIPDSDLRVNILGECFEYAENKNIKIIVICNPDKIENKDAFEKVFSERLKYSISDEERINIAFNTFSQNEKNHIKQLLSRCDHQNLRTLLKSANKFNAIINGIHLDEDIIDVPLAREILIKNIIALSIGFYEMKIPAEEMANKFTREFIFATNEKDDFASMVKGQSKPPLDLIRYCCGMEISETKIDFEGYFPKKRKGIDTLIEFRMFLLDEKEFQDAINELKAYLFDSTEESKIVYRWFNALDVYIYLNTHNFLEHHDSEESIIEKAKQYVENKISFLPMDGDDSFKIRLSSKGIKEFYHSFFYNYTAKIEREEINKIRGVFNKSWRELYFSVEENYKLTPLLDFFDTDFILNSFQKWSLYDICTFERFIQERYRASNIWKYLEAEKPCLTAINEKLSYEVSIMPNGLRKGYLQELSLTLKSIIEKF